MSDEDLFDPNDSQYDTDGGQYKNLVTPGEYLLGVRACVHHGRTDNDKLFSRFAFVVIDGPKEGYSFLDRVFRSPSSYKRLSVVCRAMRITERFNPSLDKEIERLMVGRTLKSTVEVEEGKWAKIKWPDLEWSEDELATMKEWESEFKRERKKIADQQALDGFPEDDFDDDIPF